jgi:hypothetical protein
LAELARLVEEGPNIEVHRVVRWRCLDLQAEIKARFDVELSERHVGRLPGQLKFTRLSVRPRHPQTDEAAQQAFKKTSPPAVVSIGASRLPPGGGSRQPPSRSGAVRSDASRHCRRQHGSGGDYSPGGVGADLLADLDQVDRHRLAADPGHDDGGAHGRRWVDRAEDVGRVLRLPPYGLELTPIENVWQYLRGNQLSRRVWDGYDDTLQTCCATWNRFIDDVARVTSITTRKWTELKT